MISCGDAAFFYLQSPGRAEGVLRELFQPAAGGAGTAAQDQPHRAPRERERDRDAVDGRAAGAAEGHLHLQEVWPGE